MPASFTWLGAATPTSAPLRAMKPFMASISVRRPLRMSCAIDGRWMSPRGLAPAFGIIAALHFGQRRGVAFRGASEFLRLDAAHLLERVAERLADADRLAGERDLEAADPLVCAGSRARSGRWPR